MKNNNQESNLLKEWATSDLVVIAIGLAAGYGLYRFGVLQKLYHKLFPEKDLAKTANQEQKETPATA